jgi:glutamyl-tRNA synthetase
MIRTRIAPTPSGFLHLGNIYSFVLTWLIAKKRDGVVFLRIDDLDATRVRNVYLEDIFNVLDFIGLQPDEGPSGVTEFKAKYSQHNRLFLYEKQMQKLLDQGLLYACSCSRSMLARSGGIAGYPGFCKEKNLSLTDEKNALRIKLPAGLQSSFFDQCTQTVQEIDLEKETGDFVVWKKDGFPAYQLASVVDDDFFSINYIVRGKDLLNASGAQKWLAEKLDFKGFAQMNWYHHDLLMNALGKKLSKSAGDQAVSTLMGSGLSKIELMRGLADLLKLPPKPYQNIRELLEESQLHSPIS